MHPEQQRRIFCRVWRSDGIRTDRHRAACRARACGCAFDAVDGCWPAFGSSPKVIASIARVVWYRRPIAAIGEARKPLWSKTPAAIRGWASCKRMARDHPRRPPLPVDPERDLLRVVHVRRPHVIRDCRDPRQGSAPVDAETAVSRPTLRVRRGPGPPRRA